MSGREAFEAWAKGHGAVPADLRQTPSGDYITSIIDATWHAWSARDAELAAKDARIAGLEDAIEAISVELHNTDAPPDLEVIAGLVSSVINREALR